jgi:alpha-L-fucosidase
VSDAARKYGLKLWRLSLAWDRHEPKYKNSPEYDDYYIAELESWQANYGNLVEWWLTAQEAQATS